MNDEKSNRYQNKIQNYIKIRNEFCNSQKNNEVVKQRGWQLPYNFSSKKPTKKTATIQKPKTNTNTRL